MAIGGITLSFIAYYFVIISAKAERLVKGNRSPDAANIRWVLFQRIWGGSLLGLTALLTPWLGLGKAPWDYGMSFGMDGETILMVLGIGVVVVLVNIFRAGKPANLEYYPNIRVKKWTPGLLLASSGGWVIYLLGYELMFRGFLLFGCVEALGIWPAIAVNTSIYAFAHFFKGIGETVGALPFGIILCVLTLHTENFMLAFLVHCFLAISNQTVAFFAHPDMKLVRRQG